jgi:dTDP-4-dehydrorhamnose reductase
VHAAGEGSVDRVQDNPSLGLELIVNPAKNVAALCNEHRAKLIYLSSNAVFDGKQAPYSESDTTHPINLYGKAKVQAEAAIEKELMDCLIVRTILSLGWPILGQRPNPLTFVIENLRQNRPIKLVADVFENPISALSVADCFWSLLHANCIGTFHVGGSDRVSRVELGKLIAERFDLDVNLISEASSDDFAHLAPRPPDTTLNTSKTQAACDWEPQFLRDALDQLRDDEGS